jgi:hypothetical protein
MVLVAAVQVSQLRVLQTTHHNPARQRPEEVQLLHQISLTRPARQIRQQLAAHNPTHSPASSPEAQIHSVRNNQTLAQVPIPQQQQQRILSVTYLAEHKAAKATPSQTLPAT